MLLIYTFDNKILNFIRIHMKYKFLDNIMPLITKLGDGGLIWIIITFGFLKSEHYQMYGKMLIESLLLCLLFGNIILKTLVGRIRPCDLQKPFPLLIKRPTDHSFPSGHTLSSFAAANIILHANLEMGIAAYILASLIAFSRLYLYVHYPSDILAGIFFGILISVSFS